MRDLLDQDRALSPATIRFATNVIGILFLIAALIMALYGFLTLLGKGTFLIGLLQVSAGTGTLLALFMIVRLQAEAIIAAQRTNDRLMILTDALGARADAPPLTAHQQDQKLEADKAAVKASDGNTDASAI